MKTGNKNIEDKIDKDKITEDTQANQKHGKQYALHTSLHFPLLTCFAFFWNRCIIDGLQAY